MTFGGGCCVVVVVVVEGEFIGCNKACCCPDPPLPAPTPPVPAGNAEVEPTGGGVDAAILDCVIVD